MSLKDFKTKCAEIGIVVKGAVSKLNEDEVAKIRKHLGLETEAPAEEAKPAEADDKAAKVAAEKEAKEAAAQAKEEAARKKAEAADLKRREAIGKKLGVPAEYVDFVGQVLGVELQSEDDVDEQLTQRAQKMDIVFKLSEEFEVIPREVARIARSLGLEVGRKGFKGLSPNEEFMLRAMVKQKHTTQEERLAEVQVEEKPEYKPAPPTGNKAVEAKPPEQRRTERRGRVSNEQTREVIPERFREQAGKGRGRRERFEVSQLSYDRPRGGARRRRDRRREEQDEQQKKQEMPTGPVTVDQPINLRQLSEAMGVKTNEIMGRMIKEGLPPLRINDTLSKDIIEQIGIIFEREITVNEPKGAEDLIAEQLEQFEEDAGVEETRAPIVTIMG
ncbi:MAG: hypothetical protein KDB82_00650, partial [Planctomycetes bacterium]|nr:hypothetical protein [Planctomycetota bacterium]